MTPGDPEELTSGAPVDTDRADGTDIVGEGTGTTRNSRNRTAGRGDLRNLLPLVVMPLAVMAGGLAVGYMKWLDATERAAQIAAVDSVQAATDATIAMLAYQPDNVDSSLPAAEARLTGEFRAEYSKLITDVVIPGARQQKIATLVSVPAAASVSATPSRAVVLLYVNQNVTIGYSPAIDTATTVRVTLDKIDGIWLVSAFEPI